MLPETKKRGWAGGRKGAPEIIRTRPEVDGLGRYCSRCWIGRTERNAHYIIVTIKCTPQSAAYASRHRAGAALSNVPRGNFAVHFVTVCNALPVGYNALYTLYILVQCMFMMFCEQWYQNWTFRVSIDFVRRSRSTKCKFESNHSPF